MLTALYIHIVKMLVMWSRRFRVRSAVEQSSVETSNHGLCRGRVRASMSNGVGQPC